MEHQKEKVPNLRFKGFTNDWEERKLGEHAKYRRGSFPQPYGNKEWYDGEGAMPFVQVVDVTNNLTLVENTKQKISKLAQSKSVFVPKGTVVVTLQGSIGRVAITQYDSFVDRTLLIFEDYEKETDERFWAYTIQKKFEIEKLKAPGGTIKTITKEALSLFDVHLPQFKEQAKIGSFFKKIDDTITLQQRKLDLLKQFKKGLLQKMFADKDSKRPVLRFKGFHDDWEQWKLSKVKDVRDGTHDSPKYHEKGFPLITSKNLTPSGVDFSDASLIDEHDYQEINKRSLVEIHDILFGMIGTIGNPVIVKKSGFAIKNVALIKHGGNLSNYFLLNLLNSPIFAKYINKENAGGTQKFLSLSIIRNFRFLAPGSDEQNKIGNMFEQVDTFITLQQQKLAKYQSIKKSLLQQMFI